MNPLLSLSGRLEVLHADILQQARDAGAEYPTLADSYGDTVCIVDTGSGRVWEVILKIKLRELKGN